MTPIVQDILTSVAVSSVPAALGWLWVFFSPHGKSAWTTLGQTKGLQAVAVVSTAGFLLAVGTLAGLAFRTRTVEREVDLAIIHGKWADAKPPKDPHDHNWDVSGGCSPDAKLVSYDCRVEAGTGSLTSAFIDGDEFHCVWNGIDETKQFVAKGHAICVKAAMHNK